MDTFSFNNKKIYKYKYGKMQQFTDLVYTPIGHIDVGDGLRKYYPLRTAPTG